MPLRFQKGHDGMGSSASQVVHLVPKSKGHEVTFIIIHGFLITLCPSTFFKVVQDRSHLYEPSQSTISDINDVVNGVMVSPSVHAKLSNGFVAFLKV